MEPVVVSSGLLPAILLGIARVSIAHTKTLPEILESATTRGPKFFISHEKKYFTVVCCLLLNWYWQMGTGPDQGCCFDLTNWTQMDSPFSDLVKYPFLW